MLSSKSIPPNSSGTKQGCSQCREAAAEPRLPCRAVPLPAGNIFQCHFKARAGKAEHRRAVAQQLGCRCAGKPTPAPQHPCTSPSLRPHTPSACGGGAHPRRGLILNFAQHLAPLRPSPRLQSRFAVRSAIKSMRSKPGNPRPPVLSEITHVVFPLDWGIIISACQLARTGRAHPPAGLLAARASCAAWCGRNGPFPSAPPPGRASGLGQGKPLRGGFLGKWHQAALFARGSFPLFFHEANPGGPAEPRARPVPWP